VEAVVSIGEWGEDAGPWDRVPLRSGFAQQRPSIR
jgi:hypothetical protein